MDCQGDALHHDVTVVARMRMLSHCKQPYTITFRVQPGLPEMLIWCNVIIDFYVGSVVNHS